MNVVNATIHRIPPDAMMTNKEHQPIFSLPPASIPTATPAPTIPPAACTNLTTMGGRRGLLNTTGALVAEDDEGAVEYKWRLTNISATRFEHLKTQMQFRVAEGQGQCYYELGVADDGVPRGLDEQDYNESIDTVRRLAESLGFDMRIVHERIVADTPPLLLRCVEILVTKQLAAGDLKDLRIAFCGETDTGKSTLVAVLVHGTLDDGSGVARQGLFNHKHELTSGQTSSLSRRVLGFDDTGRVTNYDVLEERCSGGVADVYGGAQLCAAMNTTRTIAERSVKLVTLMDLGGARRYSKTALLGMTSRMPGYACICARVDRATQDVEPYITLCRGLRIPFFVVLTKADTVNELELDDTLFELQDVLEQHYQLKTLRVESDDDVQLAIGALAPSTQASPVRVESWPEVDPQQVSSLTPTMGRGEQRMVPVFVVSSVAGTGVAELKQIFHGLPIPPVQGAGGSVLPSSASLQGLGSSIDTPTTCSPIAASQHTTTLEVLLDGMLQVPRVGTVLCGFVAKGTLRLNDTAMVGPDRKGNFHPVAVEGIHVKGAHVAYATAGLEVTIAIRHLSQTLMSGNANMNLQRKGNVLVNCHASPNVCVEFDMEIQHVLTSTTSSSTATDGQATGDGAVAVRCISTQQEPIVHTRNIRQAARILHCTGADGIPSDGIPYIQAIGATLHCKFLYNAEVLSPGATVLLRWNLDAKLMGVVTVVHPITPTTSPAMRPEAFPALLLDDDEDVGMESCRTNT